MPADAKNAYTLDDVFNDSLSVRIYGKSLKPDITVSADGKSVGRAGQSLAFVSVRGFAVGSYCRRLPTPILLALPGAGDDPDDGDTCAAPTERVWRVPFTATSTALMPASGTIEEILREAETRGIDGGIQLENPRISDGKACVDVRIWARISIFGASVGFDERFPVCIPLEGCHTVWDIGWARLEVCFRAPKQLCAKVCAGKWGIEKCWDYCVDLPIT